MNVAEKVLQLKQDFDDVYAAGKAAGGGSGDYDQGYEDGKNSVVPLERYATNISFSNLNVFGTEKAEINLDSATNLSGFCYAEKAENANTKVKELTINCPNAVTSINRLLSCEWAGRNQILSKVILNIDTSKCSNFAFAFGNNIALETIDGQPLNFGAASNAYNMMNIFTGCNTLKSFRVVSNSVKYNFNIATSKLLDTETIQSIIDGLADLTCSTAQTLTLHATVVSKLTD